MMTPNLPEAVVTGEGPIKLLIIHGWYGDHRLFDDLVAAIDPHLFTTARFDIRGYGRSQGYAGRFDLAEVADDARRVADALGWERFAVIGHSMGGKVAQKIAMDHPDRVTAVAAITPVPATPLGFDAETRSFFAQATENDAVAQAIVAQSAGSKRDAGWVAGLVAATRQTALPAAFGAYGSSFVDDDFSASVGALTAPLLVLFGAEDRGVDHNFLEPVYRSLYAHAAIEIIPGTGHYPMTDEPEGLARRLMAFLADAV